MNATARLNMGQPIHSESKTVWPIIDSDGDCVATVRLWQRFACEATKSVYRVIDTTVWANSVRVRVESAPDWRPCKEISIPAAQFADGCLVALD